MQRLFPRMGVTMVRITVSGHPGSGTSTLVKGLADRFGWSTLNGGDVFRSEAKRRGLSLHDFEVLCKDDEAVDRSLDALLQETMVNEEGLQVVESRLAGWWAHRQGLDCLRIWLDVSEEERARRVVAREGLGYAEALEANRLRVALDGERFDELYGLSPEDPEPYTHVLEASTLSAHEILDAVVVLLGDVP